MYLDVFKHEERFGLQFQRLNGKKKAMTQAFSSYKLRNKTCMVYLKVKLQQDRCR